MTWLDIIVLLPILVGLVIGLKKGLIIELSGLLTIIVGYLCTHLFGAYATGWLMQQFTWSEAICSVVAHALLFVAVSLLLHLLAKLLTKLFKTIKLGWLNRLLGGVFGMIKWAAIVLFAVLCLDRLDQQFHFLRDELKQQSVVYTTTTPLSQKVWQQVKGKTTTFLQEHKLNQQDNEQN